MVQEYLKIIFNLLKVSSFKRFKTKNLNKYFFKKTLLVNILNNLRRLFPY